MARRRQLLPYTNNAFVALLIVGAIAMAIYDGQQGIFWVRSQVETSQIIQHISAPHQYRSPSNPMFSNQEVDLIIWSKVPLAPNIYIGDYIVSRSYHGKGDPQKMEQALTVDFRLCDDQTCPTNQTNTFTKEQLGGMRQYRQNQGKILSIYQDTANLGKDLPWTKQFDKDKIEAITFWSTEYQTHIPITFDAVFLKTCGRSSGTCPVVCEQNLENRDMEYPYLQDMVDNVCKSSNPLALPPFRKFGGTCSCSTTCYTPEAGEADTSWPWKSKIDQSFYLTHLQSQDGLDDFQTTTNKCKMERREYEVSYEPRFSCQPEEPLSCPSYGDFGPQLYYIPQFKLIFCGIAQAGLREWVQFFRYLIGARDYLSNPFAKEDLKDFLMSSLPFEKAEELLNDSTWTKAVFVRNPLERLVSAYINKIEKESFTQKVFQIGSMDMPKAERPILSFSEFVDRITNRTESAKSDCRDPNGLNACTNPHWKPQLMTCGLDHLLPKFDFVRNMDHMAEHTQILLKKVGAWETFGANFDDGKDLRIQRSGRSTRCYTPPPERESNETMYGFNQRGDKDSNAVLKERFDELLTPALISRVREAYALDFELWEEVSSKDRSSNNIVHGADLKVVQDYCQQANKR